MELTNISEVSDIRRRVVAKEPVTLDELRAVIAFSRASRSSAALSAKKPAAKRKAANEAVVGVNLDELFGDTSELTKIVDE